MKPLRLAAVLACLGAFGCSVLIDTSERTQCKTTADCTGNLALTGRVCQDGFCVVPGSRQDPVSAEAGTGCVDTPTCTNGNSGQPSLCKKVGDPCVSIVEQKGCSATFVGGGWQDRNPIFIGSLLTKTLEQADKTTPAVPYVERVYRAMDLGMAKFDDKMRIGMPTDTGVVRHLALVHCDTQGNRDLVRAQFQHLTDVVGAQVVVVGWDEDVASIADLAAAKQTAIVCSDCTGPTPAGIKSWKILPQLSNDGALASWRVADLEARIKQTKSGDIKVAAIADPYPGPKAFKAKLQETLRFNGKDVAQNGPTRFLQIDTPDARKEIANYEVIKDQLVAFAPDIIVLGVPSDFPRLLLPNLERDWPVSVPKPHYVVTQMSYETGSFEGALTTEELRKRVSGTRPSGSEERLASMARFNTAYRIEYAQQKADGSFTGFEAFYAAAYAVAATSRDDALTGPKISSAFEKLLSGADVDVGPALIESSVTTLRSGQSINLRGLFTELDWNPATGEVGGDMGMFCFEDDGQGGLVIKDDDGVRYSAATGQTTGTYTCN